MRLVTDGVEAITFLRREGNYANAPFPDLILLDLNPPKKDGREVMKEIKDDEDLKTIRWSSSRRQSRRPTWSSRTAITPTATS